MKLPPDCPNAQLPADRLVGRLLRKSGDLSCCCCGHISGLLLRDQGPLCRTMEAGAEVYRFIWKSNFDGDAVVCVGRQDTAITLWWLYDRPVRRPQPDDAPADKILPATDWVLLQNALIVARFWALDSEDDAHGLDGGDWTIEGRRRDVYRRVSGWSPQGKVYDLGRLFLDLAGPPLSKIRVY